jgi:hypothetical protein
MLSSNKKKVVAELQQTPGCAFDLVWSWRGDSDRFDSAITTLNAGAPEGRGKSNRDGMIQGKLRQMPAFGEILRVHFRLKFAEVVNATFIH